MMLYVSAQICLINDYVLQEKIFFIKEMENCRKAISKCNFNSVKYSILKKLVLCYFSKVRRLELMKVIIEDTR